MKEFIKKIVLKTKPLKYLYKLFCNIRLKHRYIRESKKLVESYKVHVGKGRKNIYLMLRQCHSNLGDIALGIADEAFVRDNIPCSNIFNIYEVDYERLKPYLTCRIKKRDILILIGGGSLGDKYIEHEKHRRDIISCFSNNRIISFPQTMFFSDTEKGMEELANTKRVYSGHKDLHLAAREIYSYNHMKEAFESNNVMYTPDIVFYINKTKEKQSRHGIMICLRSDSESVLDADVKESIIEVCNQNCQRNWLSSMHASAFIPHEKRNEEVDAKLNEISSAKLVITDCLHGVIFSAITSTPCISISNYNYKIKGTCQWIKHLPYIKHVDNIDEIYELIPKMLNLHKYVYSNEFAVEQYKKFIGLMK